ncbi:proteasome subunit p58, related [Neospora caninum Liverpool]|uniref:Proteasome subunit p58, related n=1 Tax=Neospora caninum (strain Liverpool) TaxID=572307 RepID=F0VCF0_NEOCL|nr:proteasome subunit p58, related [Neospora caninum Liverpool]CBZ51272.1 proteasome subunit p58, related [Neospora caninum Liverpool]CEL68587.1 TPA: Proteasome subunit p58, related [Neospora caninum Liverpool]|eukprot:XP_003881305.1 proteasome subunit p58, related [Neospora caninum Liverpool]
MAKDAATAPASRGENAPSSEKKSPAPSPLLSLCLALEQLRQGVEQQDDRPITRMFRQFKTLRTACSPQILLLVSSRLLWDADLSSPASPDADKAAPGSPPKSSDAPPARQDEATLAFWKAMKDALEASVSEERSQAMDVDETPAAPFPLAAREFAFCSSEVETLLALLLLVRLIDSRRYAPAVDFGDRLVDRLLGSTGVDEPPSASPDLPRRRKRLDFIGAKCIFYWYRARELSQSLNQTVRAKLLSAYTVASVQHDTMSQATVLNLLLRNYISCNQYELALKLNSKACFPENLRSNAQQARHLYYLGSIQAVRLEYSAAFAKLQMALRKAPQQPRVAAGFRLAVLKKAIVVELLMGDIPERAIFSRKETRAALLPYKHIVLAVRSGDLHAFARVMSDFEKAFIKDGTLFLIRRLHHNVIRAGLRLISLSYSRISLEDVAQKLGLDSATSAENIVAKAILDGVIEATIDHEKKYVESKASVAIYSSTEPQKAFNKRITFCLQLHTDAVKAMQYPEAEETQGRGNDDADERRKALQEEMARVEDEELDDDDSDML